MQEDDVKLKRHAAVFKALLKSEKSNAYVVRFEISNPASLKTDGPLREFILKALTDAPVEQMLSRTPVTLKWTKLDPEEHVSWMYACVDTYTEKAVRNHLGQSLLKVLKEIRKSHPEWFNFSTGVRFSLSKIKAPKVMEPEFIIDTMT